MRKGNFSCHITGHIILNEIFGQMLALHSSSVRSSALSSNVKALQPSKNSLRGLLELRSEGLLPSAREKGSLPVDVPRIMDAELIRMF